jgi:hypothetical protein
MIEKLPYMNQMADVILNDLDTFVALTQETLKDREFSLEARWALYLKIEKLLPAHRFYPDHLMILTDSPYDDLNLDRYETRDNSFIDEQLRDNQPLDGDEDCYDYYKHVRMWAKRDEWREAVLQEGHGSFTYDW